MKKWLLLASLVSIFSETGAQVTIKEIKINNHETSMRGLYAVDDTIVWASGKEGKFLKTTDGKHWITGIVSGCDRLDFRDIHAFDDRNVLVMSSGRGGFIYKTTNGGDNWDLVYANPDEGIFFNGMDFWDSLNGLAYGDPIGKRLVLIKTKDGGKNWQKFSPDVLPESLDGEAGFAASGTGIVCIDDSVVFIGLGNAEKTRILRSNDRGETWQVFDTPLRNGEASGIYSMSFQTQYVGIIVGGNYKDSTNSEGNCAITSDGGQNWLLIETGRPKGYRSCVCFNSKVTLSTGETGTDISYDNGKTWQQISSLGYYSCVLKEKSGWLAGFDGKFAKILIE